MLEITTEAQEAVLAVDFADVYKNSELYMYVFYAPWDFLCTNFQKNAKNPCDCYVALTC